MKAAGGCKKADGSKMQQQLDKKWLHNRGWVALQDGPPNWPLFTFTEEQHDKWSDRIIELLEGERPVWNSCPNGERPGKRAADNANETLKSEGAGIWITAVHPSVSDESWQLTGPRWYASIIDATRGRCDHAAGVVNEKGQLARPPPEMQHLLWPAAPDAVAPWVTEIGWTIVPPKSDPQDMHADIVAGAPDRPGEDTRRQPGVGRYHHMAWKADHLGRCTTQLVEGAFTDGNIIGQHYQELTAVGKDEEPGAMLVIDSECLHCGGPTHHLSKWSTTCTVQICSTQGWPALQTAGRVDPALMPFTIPVAPDHDAGGGGGGGGDWSIDPGAAAAFVKRQGSPSAPPPSQRPRWAATSLVPEPAALAEAMAAARAGWAARRAAAPDPAAVESRLRNEGWFELRAGLPAAWAEWEPLALVEAYHEVYGELISAALAVAGGGAGTNGLERPGDGAAEQVTAAMQKVGLGIAVYTPPPSQRPSPPYPQTSPRYYISITDAAFEHFGGEGPPLPKAMHQALWPLAVDQDRPGRLRGLGWALAPPGSDPQTLHADIWPGQLPIGAATNTDRTPFPHLLWKSLPPAGSGGNPSLLRSCTTDVVPGGFTSGTHPPHAFSSLVKASAPAILVNAELLHRGGATAAAPAGGGGGVQQPGHGWVSSCSVEFCSASGWDHWLRGTGGTVRVPSLPAA